MTKNHHPCLIYSRATEPAIRRTVFWLFSWNIVNNNYQISLGSPQLIHFVCVNMLRLISCVPSFLCKKKGFLQNGHMFIFLNKASAEISITILTINIITGFVILKKPRIEKWITKPIGGNKKNMVFFLDISLLYAIFLSTSIDSLLFILLMVLTFYAVNNKVSKLPDIFKHKISSNKTF